MTNAENLEFIRSEGRPIESEPILNQERPGSGPRRRNENAWIHALAEFDRSRRASDSWILFSPRGGGSAVSIPIEGGPIADVRSALRET